jgi:5'(3')-deoxyribonucleotidase
MDKQKIFMDIDGTIINSYKALCYVYNNTYSNHKDFKPAQWYLIERYDAKCQCPLISNILELFDNPLFFENAEFLCGNTYDVLKKVNEKYDVIPTSIGTFTNLSMKAKWIRDNIPFIKQCILLNNGANTMNKGIVNMKGGIIVDDVLSNLESSNADFKIIMGDEYEWNKSDKYVRCYNFADLERILL